MTLTDFFEDSWQEVRAVDQVVPPLEVPPPRPGGRNPFLGILLGAAAGGGAVALVMGSGRKLIAVLPGTGALLGTATVVLALFAIALAPLIHELGHVAAGWFAGYRFVWLAWGPIQVHRQPGGLTFSRNRSLALAGGMALSVPPVNGSFAARHAMLFFAGGPLLSLAAGGAAFAVASHTGTPAKSLGPSALILCSFGVASLGIGGLTLIPSGRGGVLSDGARILRALRDAETTRRDAAVAALLGMALGPERPREWPPELLTATGSCAIGPSIELLHYYYALDRGDVAAARDRLQDALDQGPTSGLWAAAVALEAAFFEIALRRDSDRARSWLARAGPGAEPVLRKVVEGLLSEDKKDVTLPDLERLSSRVGAYAAHVVWTRRVLETSPDIKERKSVSVRTAIGVSSFRTEIGVRKSVSVRLERKSVSVRLNAIK